MLATRSLVRRALPAAALFLCVAGGALAVAAAGQESQVSKPFKGPKVNRGTVTFTESGDRYTLSLSSDFEVPDAPAPHWRVIDAKGNAYLLQRLDIKGDRINRTITIPEYVPDLKKVQMWCAWAQVVLGETTFKGTIKLAGHGTDATRTHVTSRFSGAKVNAGTVTHLHAGRTCTLTLSEDFVTPDAPAPHWQVVDARGNVYLLERLMVQGAGGGPDVLTRTIEVPAYVRDIASVQIWCAWAETLLGEARFQKPVG